MKIAPTLLCADPLNLEKDIAKLDALDIQWHHVDIMDGHYVPNLAFGVHTTAAVCKTAKKPVDCHFMTERPADYIAVFAKMKPAVFTFHLETTDNPFRLAAMVREAGMLCGVALNPITPVAKIEKLLPYIDLVLIMAVEPGFAGQKFIPETMDKISECRKMANAVNKSLLIEIDGGIEFENAPLCINAGADILVGGTFTLFRSGYSFEENFSKLINSGRSIT